MTKDQTIKYAKKVWPIIARNIGIPPKTKLPPIFFNSKAACTFFNEKEFGPAFMFAVALEIFRNSRNGISLHLSDTVARKHGVFLSKPIYKCTVVHELIHAALFQKGYPHGHTPLMYQKVRKLNRILNLNPKDPWLTDTRVKNGEPVPR